MSQWNRNAFYNQIHEYTPLTQDEIVLLYQSENIDGLSYQQQLNTIRRKKSFLYETSYLSLISNGMAIPTKMKEEMECLEEQEQEIQKKIKDEFSKLQFSIQKKRYRGRNYPSRELQAQIFLGSLQLLNYPVWKKYTEMRYQEEYDDIYQVAAMALWSAAYYYVPSIQATFKTYATKCIQNQLNKTFYLGGIKKKRKKVKPLTLEKELERMRLLKDFLDAHVLSQRRNRSFNLSVGRLLFHKCFIMNNIPTKLKLQRFNKKILELNKELLALGKNLYPRVGRQKDLEEEEATYQKIIETFSKYLRTGSLNELISNEDREFINLMTVHYHVEEKDRTFFVLRQYVCLYIYKLNRIQHYLKVEKNMRDANGGILPSMQDTLSAINRDVKEFNKKYYRYHNKRSTFYTDEVEYKAPISFHEAYYEEYGIDFLSQYDCSREEEKEILKEDYEVLVDQLEELVTELEYEEENQIILHLSETDNYYEIGEDENAISKEEALKKVKDFIKRIGTEEEYVSHVLADRTKAVKQIMVEKNKTIYQYNEQIEENLPPYQASSYQRSWNEDDVAQVEKDIEMVYSSEDLVLLSEEDRKLSRRIVLSTEEQAMVDDFLTTYYRTLDTLPKLEKEVLLRWYDEEGRHTCPAQEIGKELGISPKKVYQLKDRGLHRLASNPDIIYYKES